MIVITVLFEIKPEYATRFREAMVRQAKRCLDLEAGCRQFDVCQDPDDPTSFFLYEVYDDEAALAHHNDTLYFHEFRAHAKDWIKGHRLLKFARISPPR